MSARFEDQHVRKCPRVTQDGGRLAEPSITQDERGQALAFGAVLLVTLAIGMYLVADFGHHVHEKIHVQTTVDATAFSLATLEAQSFNYVAFTNRAQVTHYLTMMNIQAWVSYASWIEHTISLGASLAYLIGAYAGTLVPELRPLQTAGEVMHNTLSVPLKSGIDALDVLESGSYAVLSRMNTALWVSQMVVTNVVNVHLMSGGFDVFTAVKNDPDWNPDFAINVGLGNWAAIKYQTAFSTAGGFPGPLGWSPKLGRSGAYDSSDEETIRLQRAMTDVINGSRYDKQLVNRQNFPSFGSTMGIADGMRRAESVSITSGIMRAMDQGNSATRIVGDPSPGAATATLSQIFDENDAADKRGQTLASQDTFFWGKGGVWASVRTGATGKGRSAHCRADPDAPWPPTLALLGQLAKNPGMKCVEEDKDANHKWEGIAPYMSLAAAGESGNILTGDRFHQPDIYVYLNKEHPAGGFAKGYDVRWTQETASAHLQTGWGNTMPAAVLAKGIHGIARAQAYYHRPGNWQEPPNLWNPFWHARLMPIFPALSPDASSNPVESFIRQLLPLPVVYH